MEFVRRYFRTSQNETNLGTIAMGHDDIPAFFDHIGDAFHRFDSSLILILYGLMIFVLNEGVSANCDHSQTFSLHK